MRPAKILLRLKGDRPQVKAFVNVRERDKSHPKQLHLGYLNLHQELEIAKERLLRALAQKWPRRRKPDAIDWEDAAKKLAKLRLVFTERTRRPEPEPERAELSELQPGVLSSAALTVPMPSRPPDPSHNVTAEPRQRRPDAPAWHAELKNLIPDLERVAFMMTRTAEEADDLVQTTLEHALRSEFSERSTLRTWLLAIMRHRHLDSLRSASNRGRHSRISIDEIEIATLEDDEQPWQGLSLDRLREQLPIRSEDWVLLELKYLEGLSFQQLAEVFAVEVNTISSRLARAKRRVHELVMSHRDSLDSARERWR